MRLLVACAAGAVLALSIPFGSASAASMADGPPGAHIVQADWDGGAGWRHGGWHHHWRHEWHDRWHPDWHPDWHHHWHHRWDRPYGY